MFNREGRTPTHGYEATPEAAMVVRAAHGAPTMDRPTVGFFWNGAWGYREW